MLRPAARYLAHVENEAQLEPLSVTALTDVAKTRGFDDPVDCAANAMVFTQSNAFTANTPVVSGATVRSWSRNGAGGKATGDEPTTRAASEPDSGADCDEGRRS